MQRAAASRLHSELSFLQIDSESNREGALFPVGFAVEFRFTCEHVLAESRGIGS